jgi:hypothetical protein
MIVHWTNHALVLFLFLINTKKIFDAFIDIKLYYDDFVFFMIIQLTFLEH